MDISDEDKSILDARPKLSGRNKHVRKDKPPRISRERIERLADEVGAELIFEDRRVYLDGKLYGKNQYYTIYNTLYKRKHTRNKQKGQDNLP